MRANASAGSMRPNSPEPRGSVTVVVLAAGKGVRMNSRIPKVLHPVAGRPMLLWSMAAARALEPGRTPSMHDPPGYGRIVGGRNDAFRDIVEEKDASDEQKRIREVNSGVYVFNGQLLWPALQKLENKNRAGEYYLTDIVRLIKAKV